MKKIIVFSALQLVTAICFASVTVVDTVTAGSGGTASIEWEGNTYSDKSLSKNPPHNGTGKGVARIQILKITTKDPQTGVESSVYIPSVGGTLCSKHIV